MLDGLSPTMQAERNELSKLIQQLRDDYARLEESKRIQVRILHSVLL